MSPEWNETDDGHVALDRVFAWETAVGAMMVMIRVHHARSVTDLEAGKNPLQLGMSVAQARQLAEALLRAANEVETEAAASKH